jgi:hypothetical protein
VLKQPEVMLGKLCQRLEIPMSETMLSWPEGKRSFDGPWAPYWYDSVWKSTGFKPYSPGQPEIADSLKPLVEEANDHYRFLSDYKIK